MTKPRMVDLFCKAGGTTRGYQLAGFHVTGVDIEPQPNYCGDQFIQADAMTFPLDGYDALAASPPCQDHSGANNIWSRNHDSGWMLAATIDRFQKQPMPWVVENVGRARMRGALVLCGTSFGLGLHRHRKFETSFPMLAPPCNPAAVRHRGRAAEIFGHHANADRVRAEWGVEWMTRDEIAQCVPPVMTQFIGGHLLEHMGAAA